MHNANFQFTNFILPSTVTHNVNYFLHCYVSCLLSILIFMVVELIWSSSSCYINRCTLLSNVSFFVSPEILTLKEVFQIASDGKLYLINYSQCTLLPTHYITHCIAPPVMKALPMKPLAVFVLILITKTFGISAEWWRLLRALPFSTCRLRSVTLCGLPHCDEFAVV